MSAYILFESVNDYNQHGEYARHIWFTKPTLEEVAVALDWTWPGSTDEATIQIVGLWSGKVIRPQSDGSTWVIRKVLQGAIETE